MISSLWMPPAGLLATVLLIVAILAIAPRNTHAPRHDHLEPSTKEIRPRPQRRRRSHTESVAETTFANTAPATRGRARLAASPLHRP